MALCLLSDPGIYVCCSLGSSYSIRLTPYRPTLEDKISTELMLTLYILQTPGLLLIDLGLLRYYDLSVHP